MSRYEDERRDRRNSASRTGEKSELSAAAARLEAAIEDLMASATGAVSDKAAGVVDDLERSARRFKEQIEEYSGYPEHSNMIGSQKYNTQATF